MSKYIMLDLFSGLGGASQAMVEHPDWTVIRVDNNPLVLEECPDTIICDILNDDDMNRKFPVFFQCDLIWASPPCTEFSDAYAAPLPTAKRNGEEFHPDMSLLEKTLRIIDLVKPRHWIIENVRGSMPYFHEYVGSPRVKIPPYYLYGDFPLFHVNLPAGYKKADAWSRNPLRSNIRAKIPWQISEGVRQTVQYQNSIEDYVGNHSC